MRVVLDTNVLVSALAFPGSKSDQILSRIRREEIEIFVSPFILSELNRVLQEKFRFTKKEAEDRVKAISALAHLVDPTERLQVVQANEDDNRILECAVAAQADFLVTGDKQHLLPLASIQNTKIIAPAEFLERLAQL